MTITRTVKDVARRVGGGVTNKFGGVDFIDDHHIIRLAVEDVDADEVEVIVLGPAPARLCEGSARLSGVFATADAIIATVGTLDNSAPPAPAGTDSGLSAVGFLVPANRVESLVDLVTRNGADFGCVDSVVHPDPDVIFPPSDES